MHKIYCALTSFIVDIHTVSDSPFMCLAAVAELHSGGLCV